MLEMPYQVKENLRELEIRVGQIYEQHQEQARIETEHLTKAILRIRGMYPAPLLATELMLLTLNAHRDNERD